MKAELECVGRVLERHMDHVEILEDSLKANKYDLAGTIYQRVWLSIELHYDSFGLKIDRILESRFMNPDGIPDQDTFADKTSEYSSDPFVKKLLESINKDIQKACL